MLGRQSKVAISVGILLLAVVLTAAVAITTLDSKGNHRTSDGIAIDYGNWDVEWKNEILGERSIKSVLDNIDIVWDGDKIVSVNSHPAGDGESWDVWAVSKGETDSKKIPSGSYATQRASSYTVISLSLTKEGGKPARTVDAAGNSIFGYKNASRTVATSPSISEFISSFGAMETIVGCDTATDYPNDLVSRINDGKVSYIGDMMNISFEKIVQLNPDMVIVDSSVTSQMEVANKLLSTTSIGCVVLYKGNEPQTIIDNAFLVGTALGPDYRDITSSKISSYNSVYSQIRDAVASSTQTPKGSLILYDKTGSSFTCGTDSIFNNVLKDLKGVSAMQLEDGWFTFNDEEFQQSNPDFIVVINPSYNPFSDWDEMMSHIASNHPLWAQTNAYINGKVFMVSDHASDIFQRICPRYVQMTEVLAKWIHPDCFANSVPISIGNDYENYLEYTRVIQ